MVALVYLILVLTGRVDGGILFGFLNGFIDNIEESIGNANLYDSVMNIIALALSAVASFSLFVGKTKSLTVRDIKSRKLKEAIIAAGLFFNSDGKLVKRVEMYAQTDISEDGKIVNIEKEEVKSTGSILGIFDAFKELHTITTAKIEIQSDVNDVIESTNLSQIKEMDDYIRDSESELEEEGDITGAIRKTVNTVKGFFKRKSIEDTSKSLPKEKGERLTIDIISDEELKAEEDRELEAMRKYNKVNSQVAPNSNVSSSLAERRRQLYGK